MDNSAQKQVSVSPRLSSYRERLTQRLSELESITGLLEVVVNKLRGDQPPNLLEASEVVDEPGLIGELEREYTRLDNATHHLDNIHSTLLELV